MIKVTLDTNVILSALFWQNEAYKIILLAENKDIEIFCSQEIIEEVKDVINEEEKFQIFLENKGQSIEDLINSLLDKVIIIETKTKVQIIKEDPDDDKIVECAIDSESEYLVSYNKHILNHKEDIKKIFNIIVLSPMEFLKLS